MSLLSKLDELKQISSYPAICLYWCTLPPSFSTCFGARYLSAFFTCALSFCPFFLSKFLFHPKDYTYEKPNTAECLTCRKNGSESLHGVAHKSKLVPGGRSAIASFRTIFHLPDHSAFACSLTICVRPILGYFAQR